MHTVIHFLDVSGLAFDALIVAIFAAVILVARYVALRAYGGAPRSYTAQHRNVTQR